MKGKLPMLLRLENSKDFLEIYHFTEEAFKTAKINDGNEQDFVERLRASPEYIPELAFVLEDNNQIIGHIMLTKVRIINEMNVCEVLLLAPLTVRVDYRNNGVGKQLLYRAEQEAALMGYNAVVVIGDPAYYGRFGFIQADQFDIIPDSPIPPKYVLIKKIGQKELSEFSGTVNIPE